MGWPQAIVDELEDPRYWAYTPGAGPATEPTAMAALALLGHGRTAAAHKACDLLVERQEAAGSLGIGTGEQAPHWATALAVLAWQAAGKTPDAQPSSSKYAQPIERAVEWILSVAGQIMPRSPDLGHDTTLKGWPWVEGTHSWMEPTAYCVLALRATGHATHNRTREAVVLLNDRLLPEGGCNYGNTMVLGQTLRPQLEPTGIALLALATAPDRDGKIARALEYASRQVGPETTAYSLAMGLLGLAAHDRWPEAAPAWLERAWSRNTTLSLGVPRRAMVALATLGPRSPLVTLARGEQPA
ncbi:MAG TPA: hypothetical protein VIK18_19110 [Pirellulales bacterium]